MRVTRHPNDNISHDVATNRNRAEREANLRQAQADAEARNAAREADAQQSTT